MKYILILPALCLLLSGLLGSCECEGAGGSESSASVSAFEETGTEESAPEKTIAEETGPEESKPEAFEPEESEPETSEPEASEPEASEPETSVPVEFVPPQATVETDIENPEACRILQEIAALAEEYGLSVAYRSADGAHMYSVSGDTLYDSASTIKAMYCQYLLASGVDWEDEILFNIPVDRDSASGALTEDALGSAFTVGTLIGYTIRYSDNMAYRLLVVTYGRAGYNAWVEELGIPELQVTSPGGYLRVSAADLSRGMLEILRYSQTDSRLIDLLLTVKQRVLIAAGTEYAVACKFGSLDSIPVCHEAAIVFAPEPYVLTILSGIDSTTGEAAAPFARVARLTDRLHALLSAP